MRWSAWLFVCLVGCGGVYGPIYDPGADPYVAAYDLRADGGSYGSARVVAGSAEDADVAGERRVVLRLTVVVRNDAEEDVRVGAKDVRLRYVIAGDGRVDGSDVEVLERRVTAPEESVAKVEAAFVLPAGISAGDVRAFGVTWAVERDGERYEELTSFVYPRPRLSPVVVYPHAAAPYLYGPAYVGPAFDGVYGGYTYVPPGASVYVAPQVYPTPSPTGPAIHRVPSTPSIGIDRTPAAPSLGGRR